MKTTLFQLIRFLSTGVLNTAVGLGTSLVLYHVVGLSDATSNLGGYAVGLCVSFVVNRRWTFRSDLSFRATAPRFLAVAGVAYLANLATMLALHRGLGLSIEWSSVLAVAPYTIVSYLGSRWLVFPQAEAVTPVPIDSLEPIFSKGAR